MGEIERIVASADDGTVDDEFLQHLFKGGEMLSAGLVLEAKDVLEKAFKLQPKNQKAQNLLGLTYFKLNEFERAAEIYELLVRDNPVDPTLRVNLGLVYLKLNALQRAIREFETVVDLAPDHKKAQNYLGLAYAQVGEYAKAKDSFVAAGSLTMAEKMERALKDPGKAPKVQLPAEVVGRDAAPSAPTQPPAPAAAAAKPAGLAAAARAAAASSPPVPPPPAVEEDIRIDGDDDLTPPARIAPEEVRANLARVNAAEAAAAMSRPPAVAGSSAVAQLPVTMTPTPPVPPPTAPAPVAATPAAPATAAAPVTDRPAPARPAASAPPPAVSAATTMEDAVAAAAAMPQPAVAPLADVARSLALTAPGAGEPFEIATNLVQVRVQGEILTRLEGLMAITGVFQYLPEMKRFRGRATDKAFGDGERRMVRVAGAGSLYLAPRSQHFLAIELGEEAAYFKEDHVFAFEEAVTFENGRVPSKVAPDLHLIHLRGKGKVLLSLPEPLRSAAVVPDLPCIVPMAGLVGWCGNLTPKIIGVPEEAEGSAAIPSVALSGEGWALFLGGKAKN